MTVFEREYMGRGPKYINAHLIEDMIVVRLKEVLTSAERHLVKTLPSRERQGPAQTSAMPSDRGRAADHGGDGSGDHRRQGGEPAP